MIDPTKLEYVKIEKGVLFGKAKEEDKLFSKGTLVIVADGVKSLLDHVTTHYPTAQRTGNSDKRGDGEFNSFPTYDKTIDVFKNNPSEIVKYDQAEIVPTQYEEGGNDVDYNVTGDFIDIGRFLEGVPESMGSMHNGKVRNRRVRILVETNQAWWMRESDIVKRSERVIRLVDALEAAKVRTELKAMGVNECGYVEVAIKKFDEPLTLEDVAVATHPDFARRVIFRINEWSDTWYGGYGSSVFLQQRLSALKSDLNDELTIFIEGNMDDNISTLFDKLEKMVEEELSQPQPTTGLIKLSKNGVTAQPL